MRHGTDHQPGAHAVPAGTAPTTGQARTRPRAHHDGHRAQAATGRAAAAWLESQMPIIQSELARVDAKCGVLATLATGAAAFGVTQVGHGPLAVRIILTLAVVTFAAAVVVLLRVLRPRLGTGGWCRLLPMTAQEIQHLATHGRDADTTMRTSDFLAEDTAALVHLLGSKGGKYRLLQLATDLASAGIILLALAGIAAAAS